MPQVFHGPRNSTRWYGVSWRSVATIADSSSGIVAQVSDVVDGDTIDVVFADGSTDRVRLLGVDTPETFSPNSPGEYGDIADTACSLLEVVRAADEAGIKATKISLHEPNLETVFLELTGRMLRD